MEERIYFDNSATTCIAPEALATMNAVYTDYCGNPSSLHKMGSDAERVLQNSREIIAETLGVSEGEIFFTSGGTESNNWAIKGVSRANKRRGNHIVTSKTEHPSILECFSALEAEGFQGELLEVDASGLLSPEAVREKINDQTLLFSFILLNNETGVVQKAEELIHEARLKNPKTLIHLDAVQAYGKIPLNLSRLDADLLSVSSHKIHGPKGCGFLFIRRNTNIIPILHGGGQEKKYRSGTENVPAISGFATAARLIHLNMEENRRKTQLLKTLILDGLSSCSVDYRVNSPAGAYEGILNLSFPRVKAEVLLHHLEAMHIFVSVGSACSSHKNKQSHVLRAMNLPKENIDSAIRLSFSGRNTPEEAQCFIEAIKGILPKIRY